jgi:hypothetical protein
MELLNELSTKPSVKKIMIPNHTKLIISVPNAFRIGNLLKRKGNLAKSQRAEKSILRNLKELGDFIGSLPRRLLVNYLYAKSSFWGDGIIVVCKKPKP